MSFEIDVDRRAVTEMLEKIERGLQTPALQKVAKKTAVLLAQKMRPEAPVGTRPKPSTKRLRRTISARRARRDRPAAVVVVRAPHRHLVLRGTAERFDGSASRGVMPANPFVDRVADEHGSRSLDRATTEIATSLGL